MSDEADMTSNGADQKTSDVEAGHLSSTSRDAEKELPTESTLVDWDGESDAENPLH